MKETRNTVILALLIVCGFSLSIGLKFMEGAKSESNDAEFAKKLCASLESYGLWADAAQEYEKLLSGGNLAPEDRANIGYHLAEIYLEKLSMPGKALTFLFATKLIAGESDLGKKCDKKIVEALEKTGRSVDASNYLAGAAAIDGKTETKTASAEVVLAKVGSETITLRELNDEIQAMPQKLQEQFNDPARKEEFLRSLIAIRLALIAAKRAGYDDDPDVLKNAQRAKEAAILEKFEEMEVGSKIRLTDADVRAYYEAHKDEFSKKDDKGNTVALSYEEAKERARMAAENARRREMFDQTINRLQQSEGVQIYSERLKGK